MDIQEMRGLIHDVVLYECNYSDAATTYLAEGFICDIDATVEKIAEHLLNDGIYYEMAGWEKWQYEEGVHLRALDYFSSYEPVLTKTPVECPNHGGAFDCTPFCPLCEGSQEVTR